MSKHIGEDGVAITYFQRALEIRPDINKVQSNLAAALLEAEKVEDAIEIYRTADPKATIAVISARLLEYYFGNRTGQHLKFSFSGSRQTKQNITFVRAPQPRLPPISKLTQKVGLL